MKAMPENRMVPVSMVTIFLCHGDTGGQTVGALGPVVGWWNGHTEAGTGAGLRGYLGA